VPVAARVARRPAGVVVSAAFVVLVAACGGSGSTPTPATRIPSGVVAIEAKEYQFTPSTATVPAGAVAFSIRNAGSQEHQFAIFNGDQAVDEVQAIMPGLTKDATVTLAAGDYTFVCKLNGHDQLGMKGTLTVTGG
jgi:iron uptake system component EfeO